jgi:hypothetical protein
LSASRSFARLCVCATNAAFAMRCASSSWSAGSSGRICGASRVIHRGGVRSRDGREHGTSRTERKRRIIRAGTFERRWRRAGRRIDAGARGGGASDAPRRCLGGARPSRVFSSADADPRRGVAPRKGDAPQRRRERVMTQNLESLWKWRSEVPSRGKTRVGSIPLSRAESHQALPIDLQNRPTKVCRIKRNSLTELTCIKRHEFHIRVQNKKSPARVLTSSLTSL